MHKTKYIEYKGERVTFAELSKLCGISKPTLLHRYNKGLREDDLTAHKSSKGSNVTYYANGKPFRMTSEQKKRKVYINVNAGEIQNRLDIGLSMDEALNVGRNYVAKFGEICYQFDDGDVSYYIPMDELYELAEQGITKNKISQEIFKGVDIADLVLEDTTVYEESVEYDAIQANRLAEIKRQEKIQSYKDEKHREQKPHLYNGTKQSHSFGEYAQYLADSYTFACSDVKEEM